jgi:protein-disulfide isomerase
MIVAAASAPLLVLACKRAADTKPGIVTAAGTVPLTTPGDSLSTRMDQARILGDPSARVWFIMISDFQCPYCKQFHDQSFAALRQDYVATGKVRMAFINFPLPMHANAWPAAETAMCAGLQGKFWPVHDALFASQKAWAERPGAQPMLDSIASTVGVDTAALNKCVTSHASRPLIMADIDRSERAGADATPTIIIGSAVTPGVRPTASYRHDLDSAVAAGK